MPEVGQWESYFNAVGILRALGSGRWSGDVIEFGCGYGTFTLPAAQGLSGNIHAIDIDPSMVAMVSVRASQLNLTNVFVAQRDFVRDGCGRESQPASVALLFDILHIEDPVGLLKEAHRVLRPGGRVGVVHWNHDPGTPRGPPLDIRPRPEQCRAWGEEAGLRWICNEGLPGLGLALGYGAGEALISPVCAAQTVTHLSDSEVARAGVGHASGASRRLWYENQSVLQQTQSIGYLPPQRECSR